MPKGLKVVETRVSHLIANFFFAVVQALSLRETNCVIH